jgi:membrane dipeptidase
VGLEDVTKMPSITSELLKRDYGEEDVRKILGGNHLRLMKQVIG